MAGFTLEESDKQRKLLVKPSHELGDEMRKQRIEYREKFINGCIEKGLSPERATKLWDDEIIGFISYGFNKSHSLVYAYNSYQCAWLYTYFEEAWIKASLECDPNPEETIRNVRKIGYTVAKIDVNYSVPSEWSVKNKVCYPPLTSVKGVGDVAATELVLNRPVAGFKDWNDFCFDKNGEWRWSKFNKVAFDRLLKMEAFNSLDCVGKDRTFKSYKHIHNILEIKENWDKIRNKKITFESVADMTDFKDWPVAEKVVMQKDLVGYYDKDLILSQFSAALEKFNIAAIDETPDNYKKSSVWALLEKVEEKKSKVLSI
jgi:DNA polymerase-3 subunit alpha